MTLVIYQDVAWFDVSVDHICWLEELKTAKEIVHHNQHVLLCEVFGFDVGEHLAQVIFNEVHYKKQRVELFLTLRLVLAWALWHDYLVKLRCELVHLTVLELSQNRYLPQDFLALVDIWEHIFNKFDSVSCSSLPALGFHNLTKWATSNDLHDFKLMCNVNPYGIEFKYVRRHLWWACLSLCLAGYRFVTKSFNLFRNELILRFASLHI